MFWSHFLLGLSSPLWRRSSRFTWHASSCWPRDTLLSSKPAGNEWSAMQQFPTVCCNSEWNYCGSESQQHCLIILELGGRDQTLLYQPVMQGDHPMMSRQGLGTVHLSGTRNIDAYLISDQFTDWQTHLDTLVEWSLSHGSTFSFTCEGVQ